MKTILTAVSSGSILDKVIDGVQYSFCIQNFRNNSGYASIMIHDKTNDERYQSYGCIEINGHTFISKWKTEYDRNRDNYICTKDLIIEIL